MSGNGVRHVVAWSECVVSSDGELIMKKKVAKKLNLNLDDLTVESFKTSSDLEQVAGGHTYCYYASCYNTCGSTCDYSCGQMTCNGGPC